MILANPLIAAPSLIYLFAKDFISAYLTFESDTALFAKDIKSFFKELIFLVSASFLALAFLIPLLVSMSVFLSPAIPFSTLRMTLSFYLNSAFLSFISESLFFAAASRVSVTNLMILSTWAFLEERDNSIVDITPVAIGVSLDIFLSFLIVV